MIGRILQVGRCWREDWSRRNSHTPPSPSINLLFCTRTPTEHLLQLALINAVLVVSTVLLCRAGVQDPQC